MDITPDLMEAFLKCPTKCYLRAREDVETGNAYASWVRTQGDIFRSEGIKRLMSGVAPDKCAVGAPTIETGRSAQRELATDVVVRSETLRCFCHAVERSPPTGRGRAAQFTPIRFAFTNKLTRDDKLLLAFNTFVVSKSLHREVALGRIVYGDHYTTMNVKTVNFR